MPRPKPVKHTSTVRAVLRLCQVAALRTLTGLCVIALSQFSTSLQDDEAALAAGAAGAEGAAAGGEQQQEGQQAQQLSPDMQLALQFRIDKKRLLSEAVDVLAARIKVSSLIENLGGAPPTLKLIGLVQNMGGVCRGNVERSNRVLAWPWKKLFQSRSMPEARECMHCALCKAASALSCGGG